MESNHHLSQGGYDYEFVDGLDPKYECPICLLAQKDPYQTSCGHRFCRACILAWLNEGRSCPQDNCSLGEGDLFPDAMARREILQLLVMCPRNGRGCTNISQLGDVHLHLERCSFRSKSRPPPPGKVPSSCPSCAEALSPAQCDPSGIIVCPRRLIACPFTSVGCSDKLPRQDLANHVQNSLQAHMELLCEKVLKLQQIQSTSSILDSEIAASDSVGPDSLPLDSASPDNPLARSSEMRLSGSNFQAMQRMTQDLFKRIVQLEQRNCQLEIRQEQMCQKMASLANLSQEGRQGDLTRHCNGNFAWKIEHFSNYRWKLERAPHTHVQYSPGFFTASYGYKLCLRATVHLVNGGEFLGIFLHAMRGDHDELLRWPFVGSAKLTALGHQRGQKIKMEEEITITDQLKAFERPRSQMSPIGLGFPEFAPVKSLLEGGFVSKDDTLVIRVQVTSRDE